MSVFLVLSASIVTSRQFLTFSANVCLKNCLRKSLPRALDANNARWF
uniref:Uncharacterized protein n=1 Tax=Anguilla anguilla TaxID=7936 RepID=A0A0E9XE84_ANGAN